MLSWFKSNPTKKLEKKHAQLQEQAMLAQRSGDIRTYSRLSTEADELYQQIEQLRAKSAQSN